MTQRTWSGATGSYTDSTQWSPAGVPGSGDLAVINSGTVTATGFAFTNVGVNLNGTSSAAGTLILNSDTLDTTTVLTVNDANNFGATLVPTLSFQGTVTNAGTINFTGTTPSVTFAAGALLVNTGTINMTGSSPQVQATTGATPGAITNNGAIQITNASNAYQSIIVNASIGGTGSISIGSAGAVALRQSVGTGQTVTFTGGVNAGSALEIDSPGAFGATVAGFVSGDQLQVSNIPYTSFTYAPAAGNTSGVLTLYSGSTVQGQIKLSGVYSQSTFSVSANALGSGGTNNVIIKTAVTNSATGATSTSSVGAVYRFFDTKYGTHFFTADAGEKNTVLATRPDLTEETNGFGDVQSSDSNATAVYRFFDTKFGTHFFTASATERDTILSTRPDLTFEPSSTFYEHATQQTGDVAVYRFFDTQYGTHFYTGDAGEFTGLTSVGSATYRANLTYEGVGFYAPSGTFT